MVNIATFVIGQMVPTPPLSSATLIPLLYLRIFQFIQKPPLSLTLIWLKWDMVFGNRRTNSIQLASAYWVL